MGMDKDVYPHATVCRPYTVYAKLLSLLWYITIGYVFWKRPNVRSKFFAKLHTLVTYKAIVILAVFVVCIESAYSVFRGWLIFEWISNDSFSQDMSNCFQAKQLLSGTSGELSFACKLKIHV